MPLMFRSMLPDGNRPKVGADKKMLGVKAGSDKHDDIAPDEMGNVHPRTGGMSVAPAWRELPAHRIPKRLRFICPKARGTNEMEVWYLGEGPFQSEAITDRLNFRVDRPLHGMVEPATTMPFDEYEQLLADTTGQWLIDPETRPSGDSEE